ncbi:MAG: ATP-dependent DNA helicase [Candidatus Sumerlaeaceae bacterium]
MGEFVREVGSFFSEDGPLARYAARTGRPFALRDEQVSMAKFVARTLLNGQIGIVEAGTGVGKSFAYLVPALLLAVQRKKRVVVATNKINLQEQLIKKDLPMLKEALGLELSCVLLKGRNNYLSRRRLKNALSAIEPGLFYEMDRAALSVIADWVRDSKTGDKAELGQRLEEKRLSGAVKSEILDRVLRVWPEVQSDNYDCRGERCPHFRECFFHRTRAKAENADLIVTNQHVLVFDYFVAQSTKGKLRILPPFDFLIIDEAHSLVETVTTALEGTVDSDSVSRIVRRLLTWQGGGASSSGEHGSLLQKLSSSLEAGAARAILQDRLPDLLSELEREWKNCFASLEQLATCWRNENTNHAKRRRGSCQLPYSPDDMQNGETWSWKTNPHFQRHCRIFEIQSALENLLKQLSGAEVEESLGQQAQDLYQRVLALLNRLCESLETLRRFADLQDRKWCRWFQFDPAGLNKYEQLKLCVALIDVATQVADMLKSVGEMKGSVVLTSATLSVNKNFDYVLRDWGLSQAHKQGYVTTLIEESPFDYQKQCLLAVPTDLPEERINEDFMVKACNLILETLSITKGHAFLLFTSWEELRVFWKHLEQELRQRGFTPLVQEQEGNRTAITDLFRIAQAPVLFGVASFWEGVDIAGDQLRCVIIVKLPFPIPDDPLTLARAKRWGFEDSHVFHWVLKPRMITTLRQGFGRLIRAETDYGVVMILDSRLCTKSYGREVLASLPPARLVKARALEIIPEIRHFFAKRNMSG